MRSWDAASPKSQELRAPCLRAGPPSLRPSIPWEICSLSDLPCSSWVQRPHAPRRPPTPAPTWPATGRRAAPTCLPALAIALRALLPHHHPSAGPIKQLGRMFDSQRWVSTTVYLAALVLTLVSAVVLHSVILSILFIAIQFCAFVWVSVGGWDRQLCADWAGPRVCAWHTAAPVGGGCGMAAHPFSRPLPPAVLRFLHTVRAAVPRAPAAVGRRRLGGGLRLAATSRRRHRLLPPVHSSPLVIPRTAVQWKPYIIIQQRGEQRVATQNLASKGAPRRAQIKGIQARPQAGQAQTFSIISSCIRRGCILPTMASECRIWGLQQDVPRQALVPRLVTAAPRGPRPPAPPARL